MLHTIKNYKDDIGKLILRLTLGLVVLPHGAQKLLGMFGGNGFEKTMGFLTERAGLPWIIAFLVIFIEFFSALFVALGMFTRWAALSISVLFVGILFFAHFEHGFFMNWSGRGTGEGYEFHLLVIGLGLGIALLGAGKFAWSRVCLLKCCKEGKCE
jgi:putative oxidoreductase